MLREARCRARLSQTDLARRAGVAQSVISAYESDKREPGIRTLVKLIEATGHGLSVELTPMPRNLLGLPDTHLGLRLRRHRRAVIALAEQRGAHNVRVFGSVARGEDTATSDIDLLVDLDDNVGLFALAGLRRELGELLGVDVDVVPASTLKPAIRENVRAEAIAL
ncbi:nucleotidyltransferase [Amycolatopsis coloradensis]|uniref:Nucleotidyltransferase n=1 Tax=Amycolatopsis coloradensis TaxID=76021 RepID=A0A1R0KRS2_9PSEU|nr:XRE family transcriptional regulator [Amycolatopsis coloradensis]OLZ50494.1 nucleotidyltransferase [Amycolatopsis coloradensis]